MTAQQHAHADRGDDCYETPEVTTEALIRAEQLPTTIWEPACGPGAIVRVLRAAGHIVYSTDPVDYDSPDQDMAGWDFPQQTQLPIGVEMILTNPPFKLANEFVAHAISLCSRVVMLARLAFLESERRTPILEGGKLARVHVFRKRLPMMHRLGWDGPKATSAVAYAWYCWDADHDGPTEIHRL
jgi:hypothetical protein